MTPTLPTVDLPVPVQTVKPTPQPGLTFALGTTLWLASLSSFCAHDVGAISLPWHLLTTVPFLYFLCICIHDGVHGVLLRRRRLGNAAGFVLSLIIALPFPLLQRAHLLHHRRVGNDNDPEAIVYGAGVVALLLRLPFIPLFYLRTLRDLDGRGRVLTALHVVVVAAVAAALQTTGHAVLLGWALPVLLAVGWFGLTTVWVPHGPHAGVLMRFLNAHSGWHDDHHRDPRYPFHQYATIRALHLDGDTGGRGKDADAVVFWWARRLW